MVVSLHAKFNHEDFAHHPAIKKLAKIGPHLGQFIFGQKPGYYVRLCHSLCVHRMSELDSISSSICEK
jgi:hypothetical protein